MQTEVENLKERQVKMPETTETTDRVDLMELAIKHLPKILAILGVGFLVVCGVRSCSKSYGAGADSGTNISSTAQSPAHVSGTIRTIWDDDLDNPDKPRNWRPAPSYEIKILRNDQRYLEFEFVFKSFEVREHSGSAVGFQVNWNTGHYDKGNVRMVIDKVAGVGTWIYWKDRQTDGTLRVRPESTSNRILVEQWDEKGHFKTSEILL
jgi:hypothetical protein